jgi:oxygen-independent coproporphyrinogen-3 oxidase
VGSGLAERRLTPEAPQSGKAAPPVALYVHVPFCLSVCPYCDFVVYTGRASRGPGAGIARFVDALVREIELRAGVIQAAFGPERPPLGSVFLGGGTPSLLSAGQVERILAAVRMGFGLAADAEITLEANPGPSELGDVLSFRQAGVTRLSIGAQSLDLAELRRLGRRHAPLDVSRAVRAAREAGIASSVDLLYDLPDQSLARWRATLEGVVRLDVDHVSAYALSLDDPDLEGLTGPGGDHLPVRAGARRWRERAAPGQDQDRAAEMYLLADELLGSAGFEWYELSNWARGGHRSRHNLVYWQHLAYEAVGPGAHAFDGRVRRWNAARLDAYLAALLPGEDEAPSLPPGGIEPLDGPTLAAERAILGLRLRQGISRETLAAADPGGTVLSWAAQTGLLTAAQDGAISFTDRGRLLSNEVYLRLL